MRSESPASAGTIGGTPVNWIGNAANGSLSVKTTVWSSSAVDVFQRSKRALEWREQRRVENALERVDDVPRRQLVPVMKGDAMTQVRDVGERVGVVEALGQCRPDSRSSPCSSSGL